MAKNLLIVYLVYTGCGKYNGSGTLWHKYLVYFLKKKFFFWGGGCKYIQVVITPFFMKPVTSVYRIFGLNLTQKITKFCFKHYLNVFQDIPDCPIIKKLSGKKYPKAITVLKKEGGGRQIMIMITDLIVFWKPSLTQ